MSQQLEQQVPKVIDTFEKDGSFFLRTFLLDDSVARNGMGVQPEYIPKHINKFVGAPVILTPEFYHPHEFEHYKETGDVNVDLEEYRKLQQPYVIGRVIAVDTNRHIQQGNNTNYSSTLEITDPKAIAAFRRGKIPLYVSPSIYRVNNKDPIHSITDYEPLHIAIVNNPAYGFHKANIRAHCEGDKNECSRMLSQAGLPCREKQLENLINIFQGSQTSNSSFLTFQQNKYSIMSSNNVQQEQAQAQQSQEQQAQVTEEQNKQKQESVIEQKVNEQLQAHAQQQAQKQQKTPIGTPTVSSSPSTVVEPSNPPGSEEQQSVEEEVETPCQKAQKEYEAKLVELENDIKAFKEFKANFEKTQEETKLNSKKSKIENVVPINYANSEEERTKLIESLMSVADDKLELILSNFVIPATRNIRQGGLRQRAKVTDFVKPLEKNVTQASMPTISTQDLENLDKILSFGIVPKKNNGSEGGIA